MRIDSMGRKINPASSEHKTTHGGWKKHRRTYQCWQDMKQRCFNPKHKQYPNYGGRGIGICLEWAESFQAFITDMGEKPDGMTIERINNDADYSPDNCKWATQAEQNNNQRRCHYIEFDGERLTLTQWAARLCVHPTTLKGRLVRGWPLDKALTLSGTNQSNAAMREGE